MWISSTPPQIKFAVIKLQMNIQNSQCLYFTDFITVIAFFMYANQKQPSNTIYTLTDKLLIHPTCEHQHPTDNPKTKSSVFMKSRIKIAAKCDLEKHFLFNYKRQLTYMMNYIILSDVNKRKKTKHGFYIIKTYKYLHYSLILRSKEYITIMSSTVKIIAIN